MQPRIIIPALALIVVLASIIAYDIVRHAPSPPTPSAQEVSPAPQGGQGAEAVTSPPPEVLPQRPITSSDLILDLFQPTDAALKQQHSTTKISGQIENAMIVCYTLVRCNLMSHQEYSDTFNALIVYAAQLKLEPDIQHAEARVRELAQSAAASYSMVYSHALCSDPGFPEKAAALKTWREGIVRR